MGAHTYEDALRIAESLSQEEQLRLIRELAARTAGETSTEPEHSIMELCGLGSEISQGIDAQEYVNQERASWNG